MPSGAGPPVSIKVLIYNRPVKKAWKVAQATPHRGREGKPVLKNYFGPDF